MAKCDQGYLCELCGQPVNNMVESSLYLRYVLGEVALHELFSSPERHLLCDRDLSVWIVHEKFRHPHGSSCEMNDGQDHSERIKKSAQITRGWLRLRELPGSGVPITEYPLASEMKEA